jgi:hypothetical protein
MNICASNREFTLKKTFNACDHHTLLNESWVMLFGWFNIIVKVNGEFTSIFVNTMTREFDFSSWDRRKILILIIIDLLLEGIMQV